MTAARYPSFDGTQNCATADPEAFFPEIGNGAGEAKGICRGGPLGNPAPCPFLEPCFQYALHHSVSGVWAGTTGKDRLGLRKLMGLTPEPVTLADLSTTAAEPRPGDNPAVARVTCNACGKRLLTASVGKHQRNHCPGREQAAPATTHEERLTERGWEATA